jgi:hypothetical protein
MTEDEQHQYMADLVSTLPVVHWGRRAVEVPQAGSEWREYEASKIITLTLSDGQSVAVVSGNSERECLEAMKLFATQAAAVVSVAGGR